MDVVEKRARNAARQRRWRKANPEKLRVQRRQRERRAEPEREHSRLLRELREIDPLAYRQILGCLHRQKDPEKVRVAS